jgi:hypothetical protein
MGEDVIASLDFWGRPQSPLPAGSHPPGSHPIGSHPPGAHPPGPHPQQNQRPDQRQTPPMREYGSGPPVQRDYRANSMPKEYWAHPGQPHYGRDYQ